MLVEVDAPNGLDGDEVDLFAVVCGCCCPNGGAEAPASEPVVLAEVELPLNGLDGGGAEEALLLCPKGEELEVVAVLLLGGERNGLGGDVVLLLLLGGEVVDEPP